MDIVFEILIGLGRSIVAILGYGAALFAIGLTVFGIIHDAFRKGVDSNSFGAAFLLLSAAFIVSALASIVLRITA